MVVIRDLLDLWELLLRRVEVVDRYIVHGDVHYRAVISHPVASREEMVVDGRRVRSDRWDVTDGLLLLGLARLEDGRQERLVLHEGAVEVLGALDDAGVVADAVLEV